MFVLLLYGIIRICQAVREEVEQDTMRLMEQMIELDQIANQCHQSGNDEENGDLEENELKKDVTLRKQRNFILHGDDHSMTSNGTRLSDSDDDSTSEYDYNNESYYSESEREGGGMRQPGEGRTKSAIRKAYVRPPSAGSVLKDRRKQTRNRAKRSLRDLARQRKVHPSSFELEDYNESNIPTSDIQPPVSNQVEAQTQAENNLTPSAPYAWQLDESDIHSVQTDNPCPTTPDVLCTEYSREPEIQPPKETLESNVGREHDERSDDSRSNFEVSRVAFDTLVASRSAVDAVSSSYGFTSSPNETEGSMTFATAKKYKRSDVQSRPDSGYHK
ncbi:uncharacterized protein LOC142351800 isoform X2 [Convolutriloba macropyga]